MPKLSEMPVPVGKGGQRTDRPGAVNRGKTPVNTENEVVCGENPARRARVIREFG